jgi:hypothetical protein
MLCRPQLKSRNTYSNIDYSLTDMLAFCASIGFETVLDQYEMVKDL